MQVPVPQYRQVPREVPVPVQVPVQVPRHIQVPRYVDVVTEYPMTVTGKIRKVEMRAQAVKKFGLEKAASVQTA